ncbi:hypothetical protein EDD22DRAFT_895854 [Suillus occidentalis]|nr:hypothetical protein EDD22DRAFT_895854 [Suillus occidentalis]
MIPRVTRVSWNALTSATWAWRCRLIHTLPTPPSTASLSCAEDREGAKFLSQFGSRRTGAFISSVFRVRNVNKVETKVSARCRVDAPWIPIWARESLARTVICGT